MDRLSKLVYAWNYNLVHGLKISDYLIEKQVKSAAIYGMGEVGHLLADELRVEGFEVVCAFDRNPQIKHNSLVVCSFDEAYNYYKFQFDCVIFTILNNDLERDPVITKIKRDLLNFDIESIIYDMKLSMVTVQ